MQKNRTGNMMNGWKDFGDRQGAPPAFWRSCWPSPACRDACGRAGAGQARRCRHAAGAGAGQLWSVPSTSTIWKPRPDAVVAFDYTDPDAAKAYFDPSLIKLIVADSKRDQTRLDFDPFVDAQEFEIKAVDYETKMSSPREALVTARFDNFRADHNRHLQTHPLVLRLAHNGRAVGGGRDAPKLLSGATS